MLRALGLLSRSILEPEILDGLPGRKGRGIGFVYRKYSDERLRSEG